jgi:Sulfite oxidase and related enzymes
VIDVTARRDAAFATAAGTAAVAGSYLVTGWSPSFVVSPVDQMIVNLTPGAIVTFMIETVGDAGHLLHIAMAFAAVAGVFGAVSFAGLRLGKRVDSPVSVGVVVGVGSWLLAAGLTGTPVLALGAAVPVAAATALGDAIGTDDTTASVDAVRRQTLGTAAGALGVVAASIIGRQALTSVPQSGGSPTSAPQSEGSLDSAPEFEGAESRLQALDSASLSLESDSLLGLKSPIDEFYNVDITEFDPEITADEWSLTFTGETGRERTVTFDELVDQPVEHRAVSLRCVGEQLNGRKLDTAVWTGTPIRPLLESVDPAGECNCAMLRGKDGYYVQFPVDVLAEGFLAWGMNGKELPPAHGHPVRVLIPGHWGETNVKWLTEIELLDVEEDGYWEERGWEGTGEVKAVAKLWDEGVTTLSDGRIELAGHAYAGTRGISRVEVSTDGGESWTDATLSDPLPDDDVWRQWRYVFEPDGTHEAVVRAVDGEGNRQIREPSDPSPTGSSGWVRRTIET